MSSERLQFLICPTRHVSREYQPLSDRIFLFWENIWKKTFNELGLQEKLHSDSYINSDFATVIFHNNQIISLSLYKVFTTHSETFSKASYFSKWDEGSLTHLLDYGKIFNCTYFCVSEEYRTLKIEDLTVKQMNLALLLKAFLYSNVPAMAATPRRNRNMHKLLYEWGGTCLKENVPSGFGDYIDLVVYKKDEVQKAFDSNTPALIQNLWDTRKIIPFDQSDFNLMLPDQQEALKKSA